MTRLIDGLKPCGPVADPKAAERALTVVRAAAEEGGWTDLLETAWPALAPVFGASPYLTSLARRDLPRLRNLLFDLDLGVQGAAMALGQGDATVVRLTGVYHNLLRRWADS